MRLVDQTTEPAGRPIAVGASLAVELSWVLLAATTERVRADHPDLRSMYEDDAPLAARVQSFWSDGVADFGELLVLADHGGVLGTTDIDELASVLETAGATVPLDLPLATESEQDRAAFLDRVGRLRASSRLRKQYARLVRAAWAGVAGRWEDEGHRVVDLAGERYRRRLERGASWIDVVIADSEHLAAILPALIEHLPRTGAVTIAPSYFSGQGLLFDLPGGILVGVRARSAGADARARTEPVARRLKAMADPTRLAILELLASGPQTVGEIARAFALSQPTVSNHVKLLRDAGLVAGERQGSRLDLVARPRAVTELLDELRAIVGGPGGAGTSPE